jgi:hypothetical protein
MLRTELVQIAETNPELFNSMLDKWAKSGEELANTPRNRHNFESLVEAFLSTAEMDELKTEEDVFGHLRGTDEFNEMYFCLYTDVSDDKKEYVEIVYRKRDGAKIQAQYYTPTRILSLSTCCLAVTIDRPSGFYCEECGEEN